jgi:hypothetical protein
MCGGKRQYFIKRLFSGRHQFLTNFVIPHRAEGR